MTTIQTLLLPDTVIEHLINVKFPPTPACLLWSTHFLQFSTLQFTF